jgi:aryl-alcohol dehydrogenase-like predicted oxidoreductase
MKYNPLGKTGMNVSRLGFGASALGGVYGLVNEADAIKAVHAALDYGINYFDVAPAYGGTLSETVLGKALRGIARDRYFLSTKVGKYTKLGSYGEDTLDYSRTRIRASLDESAQRLGTEYFDIIHIHDIEYQGRRHAEWALQEGYRSVLELKGEGRVGAVSFGIYPMDLWKRIFSSVEVDAALVHNHYCVSDTRVVELLPLAKLKQIGIINASPFACGLLTDHGAPQWHPADAHARSVFQSAAEFCRRRGTSIAQLALQFATQNPEIPTTLFSAADPDLVRKNVEWHEQSYDPEILVGVRKILQPVQDKQWEY